MTARSIADPALPGKQDSGLAADLDRLVHLGGAKQVSPIARGGHDPVLSGPAVSNVTGPPMADAVR